MARNNKELEWYDFISGAGMEKVRDAVQVMKEILYRKMFYRNRTTSNLILAIRMEHLQIKKHQKLSMRYLHELEDIIKHHIDRI